MFSADLDTFTDADNESCFSITWPDREGQSRGVILSSAWTVDVAPAEDIAAKIAWTGSLRGLNTESVQAIHITYTVTDVLLSGHRQEMPQRLDVHGGRLPSRYSVIE